MQHLVKKVRDACHLRKTIRVLALEREHEGICRDGLRVGPPRDESWEIPIVPCGEEVYTVRTEALKLSERSQEGAECRSDPFAISIRDLPFG